MSFEQGLFGRSEPEIVPGRMSEDVLAAMQAEAASAERPVVDPNDVTTGSDAATDQPPEHLGPDITRAGRVR